ncbi:MAG: DNA polymerase I [Clostridia bacterium]|nr:DNA polymerase I [Clostridia bacterium]
MSKVFLAIDGNSLLHRAYWAVRPMSDKEGRPTHAVYGFLRMLFRLVEEYDPDHIAVAFDVSEPTMRHKAYEGYKGGRKKTPDDLLAQFGTLKDALHLLGIRYVECPGFEADDILGTLAKRADFPTYIVTGDRDELQLISDTTTVLLTLKGVSETKAMTPQTLKEDLGLRPDQIPDLKGLMGDASDNLPGVAGIGEKTALKLLAKWDSVQNLYDHIDEMPENAQRRKLVEGEDSAFMSRDLAVIVDAPVKEQISDFAFDGFSPEGGLELVNKYSFRSFADRFRPGAEPKPAAAAQQAVPVCEVTPAFLSELEGTERLGFYLTPEAFRFAAGPGKEFSIARNDECTPESLAAQLNDLFAGRDVVTFGVKDLMHELEPCGIRIRQFEDVMLAAWILNPGLGSYGAEQVMQRAGLEPGAAAFLELWDRQQREINEKGLNYIYQDIEKPLLPVLFATEERGVVVSTEELTKLGDEYDSEIAKLSQEIYDLAGEEFNIGSPKQLSAVLFDKLGLKPGKKTRTGYSTDISVLEKLRKDHPIAAKLIDYRAVAKLKNTYIDGLLQAVRDGRLHTTFLQTATATGRLSSTEPNLQNIPVRSKMAQDIRRAFVAPEGRTIVSADYSQIELRVLAAIADDANLRAAFERGEDIHLRTAAEILGKAMDEVTPAERAHAKAVNFGIVYGISDFGLSQNAGIPRKDAARYIKRYLEEFSGVKRYMDDIKQQAHEEGFVRTLFGRIRYFPDINSSNFNLRAQAERAAMNAPIQGTAADIMKIAMIQAAKRLALLDAELVLQVHDELIVYAPDDRVEETASALREVMENAVELAVPLKVNTAWGKTWQEAK